MPINAYSFALTAGIGTPLIALLLWATRTPAPRSHFVRAVICAAAALSFTPTVWSPLERAYIEAASMVIFCGLIGLTQPLYSFCLGVLPILGVTVLLYAIWHLSNTRNAS